MEFMKLLKKLSCHFVDRTLIYSEKSSTIGVIFKVDIEKINDHSICCFSIMALAKVGFSQK